MAVPVFVGDRVLVSTDTTGTGTYDLGTAVSGYLSPADAGVTTGVRVAYVVVDSLTNPSTFEVGEGTYTAGTPATISRTLIVRNSSGGTSAVSWSAGTKYLFLAPSASRFVIYDSDGGLVLNDAGVSGVASINSGPLAGFRNAVINGNFDFWQRGTSFSNPAAGAYGSDRWLINFDGSGATRTISRQAFTLGQTDVPGEPTYFYRFNQSVAGSGGTFNVIVHRIEDVRTFAGQQVTLSFYAKAAASLTMQVVKLRQNFGSGGSPSAFVDTDFGASTVVGTSFTKYTFTVTLPSISGKTLGTDNNSSLDLIFALPINTTFTFDLAQVQLEVGSVATPFERRPLGVELALCQRYYEKSYSQAVPPGTAGGLGGYGGLISFHKPVSSFASDGTIRFAVSKRASPTATVFNPETGSSGSYRDFTVNTDRAGISLFDIGETGFKFVISDAVQAAGGFQFTASSEL